jgi:Tfp pilus assembly ATPase PilU
MYPVEHLSGLNERQKEAVLQKDGPILILAGAGAGKTKTITHRILHLIKNSCNYFYKQGGKGDEREGGENNS